MIDSKKAVMDMIAKRQTYNRSHRKKEALRKGPYKIVIELLNRLDILREDMHQPYFTDELSSAFSRIEKQLKYIDPEVHVILSWHNEDTLHLSEVIVKWSRFYRKKHPLHSTVYTFDVAAYELKEVFFGK